MIKTEILIRVENEINKSYSIYIIPSKKHFIGNVGFHEEMTLKEYIGKKVRTIERLLERGNKIRIIRKDENGKILKVINYPKAKIEPVEDHSECCNCSEHFDNALTEINDENYCDDCKNELFYVCEHCEDYVSQDDGYCINDTIYCSETCATRAGNWQCADCSEWHGRNDDNYSNCNDDSICEDCRENYSTCEDCDSTIHNDDSCYCENREVNLCNDCYNNSESKIIKDYSYNPSEFIYSKMAWENTLYLGMELEIETDGNREEIAEKIIKFLEDNKLEKFVYIKEDGSLENGIELVFHPFTLQALHKKFPFKKLCDYLKKLKCTSYESGRCGFHIHLNKSHFSSDKQEIYKGKLFFFKCQKYLKKFSQRKDYNFCQLDNEMPIDETNINGRYSAFNTSTNKKTVEIRIFRGTLDYKRLLASIQFSNAFGNYVKSVGISFLKTSSPAIIWQSFLDYCKRENNYCVFVNYILKKSII